MQWFKHTSIIATLVLTTSAAIAATPPSVSKTKAKTTASSAAAKKTVKKTALKKAAAPAAHTKMAPATTHRAAQTAVPVQGSVQKITATSAAPRAQQTASMRAAPSNSSTSMTSTSSLSAPNTSTTKVEAAKPPAPIFSGFLLSQRSTSLYDFQDGTRTDGMDYTLRLAATMGSGSKYGVKLTAIYSDDLNNQQASDFKDTNLSFGRSPGPVGGYLLMSPSLGVALPTSKDSRDRQQLQAAGKLALTTIVNPEKLITGMNIMVNLVGAKNFHKFDTATDGKVNTAYSLIQNANFAYAYKAVSLSLDFVHVNTWSYQDVMRDVFEMTQELGYEINPTFAVAIGHTNGGSTLKADGVNSNVQIMDENTSMVYAALNIVF